MFQSCMESHSKIFSGCLKPQMASTIYVLCFLLAVIGFVALLLGKLMFKFFRLYLLCAAYYCQSEHIVRAGEIVQPLKASLTTKPVRTYCSCHPHINLMHTLCHLNTHCILVMSFQALGVT